MSIRWRFAMALTMLAGVSGAADALTFNLTTAADASLTSDQAAAFATAANAWSAVLADDITVNLQVGFTSLPSGVLGSTSLSLGSRSTASVLAELMADATSANDAKALASLTAVPPTSTTLALTSAQAKALGYPSTGVDAVIEFSTAYTFATSRNADGSTPSNAYDLIGVAEHEIGHALGFDSGIDTGSFTTVLDLFRYVGAGTRTTTAGSAYFSLNGGATPIASFSPGGPGNFQASHWLQGTGDLLDPAIAMGVSQNIAALDIEALDVIGYNTNVPEPGTLVLLMGGLAGVAAHRRIRR